MYINSIVGSMKFIDGRNIEKLYIIRVSRVQSHCAVKPNETFSKNIAKDSHIDTTHA